jgi:hypothetical protein
MAGAAVGAGVSLSTDELVLKRLFAGVMLIVRRRLVPRLG